MKIPFDVVNVNVTASPILKTKARAIDGRQQLMLSVRVYRNKLLIDRFNYYVNDYGAPIYIHQTELRGGLIVNHSTSIRYNELIRFLKKKMKEIATVELTVKTILNRESFKDLVDKVVKTHFNSDFVATIGQQKVLIKASGYNANGDFEVDERAKTAVSNMNIPTEPKIDPLGQVDLNDIDAGDIETLMINEDLRLQGEAERLRISKLSSEEKYKLREFETQNIFELFGSIYYEPKLSSTYDKIVIRLYEYRLFMKPKEHVNDYDEQWVIEFFKFLWTHGYSNLNTIRFDPLKFDPDIFANKKIKRYKADNLYTLLEIVQRVSNFFANKGYLRKLNFGMIDLKDICGQEQSEDGTRGEHSLDNAEFNKLFFFIFKPVDLPTYQKIFDSKKIEKGSGKIRFKNLTISISDLETARDLFCLQTMAGGIRGYKDLTTLTFNSKDKQLLFYVKKDKNKPMLNPYNVYTTIIAKDYHNSLPQLRFGNKPNSMETIYRMLCQTFAEIIPLRRQVIHEDKSVPLVELFNPYFARKTFSQIMSDEYEMDDDDIMKFTGHKSMKSKSVLRTNYLKKNSIAKKRKLFDKIKLPKGKSSTTVRSLNPKGKLGIQRKS